MSCQNISEEGLDIQMISDQSVDLQGQPGKMGKDGRPGEPGEPVSRLKTKENNNDNTLPIVWKEGRSGICFLFQGKQGEAGPPGNPGLRGLPVSNHQSTEAPQFVPPEK